LTFNKDIYKMAFEDGRGSSYGSNPVALIREIENA
jgi:hypothetical protein